MGVHGRRLEEAGAKKKSDGLSPKRLNELGAQGWEAVGRLAEARRSRSLGRWSCSSALRTESCAPGLPGTVPRQGGGWVAPGFEEVHAEFDRNSRSAARSALPSPRTGAARRSLTCGAAAVRRPRGAVEGGHDGRRQFDDQGPGGDDDCRRELARLDRLRRADRRVLARVRPERQGSDNRAPAPQPRSGAGLDRRAAAFRGLARPRPRLRSCSRARSRRGNQEPVTGTTR